jgi:hypothetical protein
VDGCERSRVSIPILYIEPLPSRYSGRGNDQSRLRTAVSGYDELTELSLILNWSKDGSLIAKDATAAVAGCSILP